MILVRSLKKKKMLGEEKCHVPKRKLDEKEVPTLTNAKIIQPQKRPIGKQAILLLKTMPWIVRSQRNKGKVPVLVIYRCFPDEDFASQNKWNTKSVVLPAFSRYLAWKHTHTKKDDVFLAVEEVGRKQNVDFCGNLRHTLCLSQCLLVLQ